MDRGSKKANVKRIRVHDLRHSHVSLLIELGFQQQLSQIESGMNL